MPLSWCFVIQERCMWNLQGQRNLKILFVVMRMGLNILEGSLRSVGMIILRQLSQRDLERSFGLILNLWPFVGIMDLCRMRVILPAAMRREELSPELNTFD